MKTFLILFLSSMFLIQCGTNFEAEGEKAFNAKDYTTAINMYEKALPKSLNKEAVREKLSLSYFYRGEELFKRTRNLKALTGNFEKAEKYLPQFPNDNFKKEYSRMLFELGYAYSITKPENELEEDEYYSNSLNALHEALYIDSNNYRADSLINAIHTANFEKLLTTANKYYDRAIKTGKVDLFLSSEHYLKKAAEFNPSDPGVLSLFRKIKKKTLAVLNYRDGVSMAISSFAPDNDGLVMNVIVKNYLPDSVALDVTNFMIMARDGVQYGIDEDAMRVRKLFGEPILENVTLNSKKSYTEGILVFDAPQDVQIGYLSYKINRRRETRKYFP